MSTQTETTPTTTGTKLDLRAKDIASALSVIIPFAATGTAEPHYLRAILIDPQADGSVRLVATNRYALGEYTIPARDGGAVVVNDGPILLGIDNAKELLKNAKSLRKWPAAMILFAVDGHALTMTGPESAVTVQTVDGQFPPFDRLFPTEHTEQGAFGLSSYTMAPLAKAFPKGAVRFEFGPSNLKGMTVTAPSVPEFRGLVKPARVD